MFVKKGIKKVVDRCLFTLHISFYIAACKIFDAVGKMVALGHHIDEKTKTDTLNTPFKDEIVSLHNVIVL